MIFIIIILKAGYRRRKGCSIIFVHSLVIFTQEKSYNVIRLKLEKYDWR